LLFAKIQPESFECILRRSKMDALSGGYKQARWAAQIRSKTMAGLDAMAEQFNDNGKQAIAIAREDLLTHTDAFWWTEHCNDLTTPDGIFCSLSDETKAAINALKQSPV
jgi:hypothetical protein